MAQRKNNKSESQWLLSPDSSSSESESILSEGLSEERKTRTPPKAAAHQKNAKARAGSNMDTKKRGRLDESPGLVQMFSPGAPSSSDSESSLSFRKHIAHGKKRKKTSSLRKQKSKDSFLDDDSDNDEDSDIDSSSFEDDNDNTARLLTPKKGNLSKRRGPSKKAPSSKSHRGKQKAVPMKGAARRDRQHAMTLGEDTSDDDDDDDSRSIDLEKETLDDDDDDDSRSIDQQSDLSQSLATDLSDSENDTNTDTNDSILHEPRFVADGSGKKPMHALNLQFAVHLLEEQAEIATSKVCSSLSRKGLKQESKRLQVRSDKHSTQIIGKIRQRLRSTKLPDAYTRAQDPLAEPMDRINSEREKDLERTEIVLEKLAQQRERLEEELKQETLRYDKLAAERARAQADDNGDDDDDHAHSLLLKLNGVTTTAVGGTRQKAVPLQLQSAPKGTMARLVLKIAKTCQDHEH
jgi:hypothetical protein